MKSMQLLTRADDAGLNRTTNRAIRATVKQGIVKNISVLATAPAVEDAAEVLADLTRTVDFGLHVCLTSEWKHPRFRPRIGPENAASLVRQDGSFPSAVAELAGLTLLDDEISAEIEAQYSRLKDLGFEISYVDEHMLVGQIPGVSAVLSAFTEKYGLIYSRGQIEAANFTPLPGWDSPGPHPGTELADHLSSVDPGRYLVVGHPGFKADEMQRLRRDGGDSVDVLLDRNRQRRMFADIEIVDYCENARVQLLRYSEL